MTNINENQNLNNIRKCPRFDCCSANSCPIDINAHFRRNLPNEDYCPFTIKKKPKGQKGAKTLTPYIVLEVIPNKNHKMLNMASLKRLKKIKNKE